MKRWSPHPARETRMKAPRRGTRVGTSSELKAFALPKTPRKREDRSSRGRVSASPGVTGRGEPGERRPRTARKETPEGLVGPREDAPGRRSSGSAGQGQRVHYADVRTSPQLCARVPCARGCVCARVLSEGLAGVEASKRSKRSAGVGTARHSRARFPRTGPAGDLRAPSACGVCTHTFAHGYPRRPGGPPKARERALESAPRGPAPSPEGGDASPPALPPPVNCDPCKGVICPKAELPRGHGHS